MSDPSRRGFASAEAELVSFDGGTRCRQTLVRPDRYRHLEALGPKDVRIVRGGGYSYAAASFGAGGIQTFPRQFGSGSSTSLANILATMGDLRRVYSTVFSPGYDRPVNRR